LTKKLLFKEKKLFQTASDYFRSYNVSTRFSSLFGNRNSRTTIMSRIELVKDYLDQIEESLAGKKKRLDYIYERLEKKREEEE